MIELKPCPFCGYESVRLEQPTALHDVIVYCDGCDIQFALDDMFATAEDTARAWNRRAERETPCAQNENAAHSAAAPG